MLINKKAIDNKIKYLDSARSKVGFVEGVVHRHFPDARIVKLPRIWEPGGGASLYRIETADEFIFLKVKHTSVWTENRLECETAFREISSLKNEYIYFSSLRVPFVPRVIIHEVVDENCFLAVEWLTPFYVATERMSSDELIRVWGDICRSVRALFDYGIVHGDIHEHNICFRKGIPVLCDFEDARNLKQDVAFEESLDVIGENRYGKLGFFPTINGGSAGLTCLSRLRAVFKSLLAERLNSLVGQAKFDDSCPFNRDVLQQKDERIYQSIDVPFISVAGQRAAEDFRTILFSYLLSRIASWQGHLRHMDVGSNLGLFCFIAGSRPYVEGSVGLEAHQPFLRVSKALGFLSDAFNVRFHECECGRDGREEGLGRADFVTVLSVYHHLPDKDAFLSSLTRMGVGYLLMEFATQDRYYPERGNWTAERDHIQKVMGWAYSHELGWSADYKRPLILFSDHDLNWMDRWVIGQMRQDRRKVTRLFTAVVEKKTARRTLQSDWRKVRQKAIENWQMGGLDSQDAQHGVSWGCGRNSGRLRRLVVVPSDPIAAYEEAGYEHLSRYYNPMGFFDDVLILSPHETEKRYAQGMRIQPTAPGGFLSEVRRFHPDCVRAYGGYWPADLVCLNKAADIPVIVSVHDKRPEMIHDSLCGADLVISVSEAVVQAVRRVGVPADRIQILPNRVDLNCFKAVYDEIRFAELDRLFPGDRHILFVGRKSEEKNPDTLIRALALLPEGYTAVFVGKGDESPSRAVAEKVGVSRRCYWVDAVKNTELPFWYSWCDCLCVPSRSEGFGVVFIEAAGSGCPIVTSNAPPMNEYLVHGESAHLVIENENPYELARALDQVCSDPEYRRKLSEGGRKAVTQFEQRRVDSLEVSIYRKALRMRS